MATIHTSLFQPDQQDRANPARRLGNWLFQTLADPNLSSGFYSLAFMNWMTLEGFCLPASEEA